MPNFYLSPMVIYTLLPVVVFSSCICFILLYARKRGVPFNALNARNLTPDKIKRLTSINRFSIAVAAVYVVVRFSNIENKILIYNSIIVPLFAISMIALFSQIIRFKATK